MTRRPIKQRAKHKLKELALRPVKCPVGTAIFVIGLSGISENVSAWRGVIDRVTRDERILALAEQAASVSEWVNRPAVRISLILLGVLLILWRLPWFWRLRHKLIFNWRRLLAEEVWIDREAALDVLRNSTWGELKAPVANALEGLTFLGTSGLSPSQRRKRKYDLYLEMALDSFKLYNSSSVQEIEGELQYEQGALQRFARNAMKDELEEEFGKIPRGHA